MTKNKKNIIVTSVLGVALAGVGTFGVIEHQDNKKLDQAITKLSVTNKDNKSKLDSLTTINNTYAKAITGYKKQVATFKTTEKKTKSELKKLKSKNDSFEQDLIRIKRELANKEVVVNAPKIETKSQKIVQTTNTVSQSKPVTNEKTNTVSGGQTFNVTFYSAGVESTGKSPGHKDYGRTASGTMVATGRTIACPPQYKFGTKINIEGIGVRVCEDRGGAIQGNHLDVYVATQSEAMRLGRKFLKGTVIN